MHAARYPVLANWENLLIFLNSEASIRNAFIDPRGRNGSQVANAGKTTKRLLFRAASSPTQRPR